MEAIVLAGGLGTRLKSVIFDIPKPMAPIGEQPFLFYILKWLEMNEIQRVILSVGYKWQIIFNQFHKKFNSMELVYSVEDSPLGTGGAIAKAMNEVRGDYFFIINGDTLFNINLKELFIFNQLGKFELSMALKFMREVDRYGTVNLNNKNRVLQFNEKLSIKSGYINGGVYLSQKKIQKHFPNKHFFSFEKAFLETKVKTLTFGGLVSNNFFIDIGVPDDYVKAQRDLPKINIFEDPETV